MRKKYLSALLFGALLFASAGTFTSCKDYDDDINNLQTQIDDVKKAISELQSKVDGGKYVTNITKEGDGIKITWNDNTSSVIETIKGADGTVVTMGENGNWFIDGKDSGVSYKGENGSQGADGHDAQISSDGYWMVWNAEAGEYAKTNYVAGGVIAVETTGGWNLTVNDATGAEQTIFVPTSVTMGSIEVLGTDVVYYPSDLKDMKALYAINEKDVTYGPADAQKTLKKGLYTTLDRDLMIVVNPQGSDASSYKFTLESSATDDKDTQLKFKPAVPFEGVLSRATSANGVWVLPHDFTRYEDIEAARTENYLLFKSNDGAKHALSLTAALENTTIKTPYDLGASLKKIGEVKVYPNHLYSCAVDKEYRVMGYTNSSVDANAVYDYWLTFEQSASNLKAVELYGAKIVDDGHAFMYTRETGVNNNIRLVYNYILMDGTVVQGKDAPEFIAWMTEEMATERTVTLDRLNVPMNAEYIDGKDNVELNWVDNWKWSDQGKQVFALNTEPYSLAKLLADMSSAEKAAWNSALARNSVKLTVIGGEGDNNQSNDNDNMGHNVRYAMDEKNENITFQFCVSEGYPYNFRLYNAQQLTLSVIDEDAQNPIASIVLPFEFTQPTLDITRENGEKAVWNDDKNVLSIYGDLSGKYMYVPLYEAFTTAYTKKYTEFVPNAEYYILKSNDKSKVFYDAAFLGGTYQDLNNPLTDINYSAVASNWNTYVNKANVATGNAEFQIYADYKFYGVYPATEDQVKDFTLRFASLLGDAKTVKANGEFTANNVTREVVLTDADFTLTDALGDTFYLFDGVKDDGSIDTRSDMNRRQGFEEGTEGFETTFKLASVVANVKDVNGKVISTVSVRKGTDGTATVDKDGNLVYTGTPDAVYYENSYTKTNGWAAATAASATEVIVTDLPAKQANKNAGYKAIPGGIMIQLPSSIGTTEPVTIEFKLIDVFGVTKTLSVKVKAAK